MRSPLKEGDERVTYYLEAAVKESDTRIRQTYVRRAAELGIADSVLELVWMI